MAADGDDPAVERHDEDIEPYAFHAMPPEWYDELLWRTNAGRVVHLSTANGIFEEVCL